MPYAIIFDCYDSLIKEILSNTENSFTTDVIIIDTIVAINDEAKILNNIMFS